MQIAMIEAELVIVGGPPPDQFDRDPEVRRLREIAAGARVADRVRLVGAVPHPDLPQWSRPADVLIRAPWYEPLGLAALECMACGNPLVATAVGHLTDPARRLAYAAAAPNRARQRYAWSVAAEQLVDLCSAVGGRSPAMAVRR